MKKQFLNREGTQDNLEYYNAEGNLIYHFFKYGENEDFEEETYDSFGYDLKSRYSDGCWSEFTRCKETGKELTYENSNGYKRGFETKKEEVKQFLNREGTQVDRYYNKDGGCIYEFFRFEKTFIEYIWDNFGNPLYYRNSNGDWFKHTRCKKTGKELTFENSYGNKVGFDLPEYTMQQVAEKIGDFKLIK